MVRFMVWHVGDGRVQIFGTGRLPLDDWGVYQIDAYAGEMLIRKIGESSSLTRQRGYSRESLMDDGSYLMTLEEFNRKERLERPERFEEE